MCTRDLPDMYTLSPWASGIHIRQILRAHVTTYTCSPVIQASFRPRTKVLHISGNMCTRDLPDMYTLSPWASGIHIRQILRAHVTTYTCSPVIQASFYVSSN